MAAHTEKFLLTTGGDHGRDILVNISKIIYVEERIADHLLDGQVKIETVICVDSGDGPLSLRSPDPVSTIIRKIHNAQRRNQYAQIKTTITKLQSP